MRMLSLCRRVALHPLFPLRSPSRYMHTIRNVGIIAHIDAGKTTTSEQMLYMCGETQRVGRVDDGDTVMDFMPQERERGITISSAAINFQWKNYDISLIDTPGHVDFTIEVERSVRVIDGAVVIIDAVAGVQAQTNTVWRQAKKHNIPAIAYINKMDRIGSDFNRAVASLRKKLQVNAVPLQIPIMSGDNFLGAIDLISLRSITWENTDNHRPQVPTIEPLTSSHSMYEAALAARTYLLEQLSELDDGFMEHYLSTTDHANIPESYIINTIRACSIKGSLVPTLCGSSLKGKGVEPLLDSVLAFLPSPLERPPSVAINRKTNEKRLITADMKDLCALAFKVVYDVNRGPLVYVRNFSGDVQAKQMLHNTTKGEKERATQLLDINADDMEFTDAIPPGRVGCIVGLKHTRTGDTLVQYKGKLDNYVLDGLSIPDTVYSLSIETEKSSDEKNLLQALSVLAMEDPSMQYEVNEESGQILLKGVGELHLEIICDRIRRQFNIEVYTGKAYVAYRESLREESFTENFRFDRMMGGKRMFAGLSVRVQATGKSAKSTVSLSHDLKKSLSAEEVYSLTDGFLNAFAAGPKGYPIVGLEVTVENIEKDSDTTHGALRACSHFFVDNIMKTHDRVLLEPAMSLYIELPEKYIGDVLSDLTVKRRADIREVNATGDHSIISAVVPLATSLGYATAIRTITQGMGYFTMEYLEHQVVDDTIASMDMASV